MRLLLLFILLPLFISCSAEEHQIQETESEILNNYLQAADQQILDLEGHEIDTVALDSNNVIGLAREGQDSVLVGRIVDVEADAGTVHILDSEQTAIISGTQQQGFYKKTGREGRGPAEFQRPVKIFNPGEYIYVADRANYRIHQYDRDLNFLESMEIPASADPRGDIEVGSSFILFPLGSMDEQLVEVKSREDSLQSEGRIAPELIERGYQPFAYNKYWVATNNERIIFTYVGLPYLFVYNSDVEHIATIQLQSAKANEIKNKNPSLQPFRDPNDGSILDKPVYLLTTALEIGPDSTIYIVQNNVINILRESREGYYEVSGRYRFTSSFFDLAEFIDIKNIALDDGQLYFHNIFVPYIFSYELN